MKKILLLAAVMLTSLTVSAQVYVGGSFGFGSVKIGGGDAEAVYKILPEVGYVMNDSWAFGAVLGYQKGECTLGEGAFVQDNTTEAFIISPYARYTPLRWGQVSVIFDGGLGYASYKDLGTQFMLGVRPGVAISLGDHFSFVTHLGFVGFETFSPDGGGKSSNAFGVDLKNNCSFGVYYSF